MNTVCDRIRAIYLKGGKNIIIGQKNTMFAMIVMVLGDGGIIAESGITAKNASQISLIEC